MLESYGVFVSRYEEATLEKQYRAIYAVLFFKVRLLVVLICIE